MDSAASSLGAAVLAAISSRTFSALVTSRFGKLRSWRFAADFVFELFRAPVWCEYVLSPRLLMMPLKDAKRHLHHFFTASIKSATLRIESNTTSLLSITRRYSCAF